jgi:hypothetical protein
MTDEMSFAAVFVALFAAAPSSRALSLLMKRFLTCLSALACAGFALAPAASAAPVSGALTGRITYVGSNTLTIQTNGHSLGVITAMTRTATALTAGNYAYVWGGGHAMAGVASVRGRNKGFDCSGSVAAVLAGAGLYPAGAGVPNDYGVIQYLRARGLIARGPGKAPNAVNLYDHPGVHIFMSIDGRFFGTSDGGGGNRKGGPTWLDDGAWDSYSKAFHRWHFLPSVLRNHTIYGHSYTFQTFAHPEFVYGTELGDKVTVDYTQWNTGSMGIRGLDYAGAHTINGTVTAGTGSTLTVQTQAGKTLVFSTALVGQLLSGVQVADGVQITYAKDAAGRLIPHALQITSTPLPPAPTGGPTSTGPGTPTNPGTPSGNPGTPSASPSTNALRSH